MFVMIDKKGSRDDYGNYRVICLLCHSYELMSAIVARRLMETLDLAIFLIRKLGSGRRGVAETTYICALKWLIQMILREGRQAAATGVVHIYFIRQADGSIALSKPFNLVLQGDIFSPTFIAGVDRIFRRHNVHMAGVTVGSDDSSMNMSKFEYADDAALVDDDAGTATTRVTVIATGSLRAKL